MDIHQQEPYLWLVVVLSKQGQALSISPPSLSFNFHPDITTSFHCGSLERFSIESPFSQLVICLLTEASPPTVTISLQVEDAKQEGLKDW